MFRKLRSGLSSGGRQRVRLRYDVTVVGVRGLSGVREARVVWSRQHKVQIYRPMEVVNGIASWDQELSQISTLTRDPRGFEQKLYLFRLQAQTGPQRSPKWTTVGQAVVDMAEFAPLAAGRDPRVIDVRLELRHPARGRAYLRLSIRAAVVGPSPGGPASTVDDDARSCASDESNWHMADDLGPDEHLDAHDLDPCSPGPDDVRARALGSPETPSPEGRASGTRTPSALAGVDIVSPRDDGSYAEGLGGARGGGGGLGGIGGVVGGGSFVGGAAHARGSAGSSGGSSPSRSPSKLGRGAAAATPEQPSTPEGERAKARAAQDEHSCPGVSFGGGGGGGGGDPALVMDASDASYQLPGGPPSAAALRRLASIPEAEEGGLPLRAGAAADGDDPSTPRGGTRSAGPASPSKDALALAAALDEARRRADEAEDARRAAETLAEEAVNALEETQEELRVAKEASETAKATLKVREERFARERSDRDGRELEATRRLAAAVALGERAREELEASRGRAAEAVEARAAAEQSAKETKARLEQSERAVERLRGEVAEARAAAAKAAEAAEAADAARGGKDAAEAAAAASAAAAAAATAQARAQDAELAETRAALAAARDELAGAREELAAARAKAASDAATAAAELAEERRRRGDAERDAESSAQATSEARVEGERRARALEAALETRAAELVEARGKLAGLEARLRREREAAQRERDGTAEVEATRMRELTNMANELATAKLAWAEAQGEVDRLRGALYKSRERGMVLAAQLTTLETRLYERQEDHVHRTSSWSLWGGKSAASTPRDGGDEAAAVGSSGAGLGDAGRM